MEEPFGVITLSPVVLYTGPRTSNTTVSDPLKAHKVIRESGCQNLGGRRIPVDSKLNVKNWKYHLQNFGDKQLLDLLEYGFPLNFDRNLPLIATEENHASTKNYANDVYTYIGDELKHGTMSGPFKDKPIDLHVSPFIARHKPDSDVRRTIVDLS